MENRRTRVILPEALVAEIDALVDHGFSFPMRYFEVHGLPHDWQAFLDDFQDHWPKSISCATASAVTARPVPASRASGG